MLTSTHLVTLVPTSKQIAISEPSNLSPTQFIQCTQDILKQTLPTPQNPFTAPKLDQPTF